MQCFENFGGGANAPIPPLVARLGSGIPHNTGRDKFLLLTEEPAAHNTLDTILWSDVGLYLHVMM